MIKHAFLAAAFSAFAIAVNSGCCSVDRFCGLSTCGNQCGGCDSCSSCGGGCSACSHGCSSCGNDCGSGGCSSCGSCNSGCCGGCNSCGSCGGGCKDWFLDCSWLKKCFTWCQPETFNGCGCGEKYWCDWKSCPPTPDPCDKCGGYCGGPPCAVHCYQESPRFGSVIWPPHDDGGVVDGDNSVGQKPKTSTITQ